MQSPNTIHVYIDKTFPKLGLNKRNELVRLFFEIAKKEGCDFKDILNDVPEDKRRFLHLKKMLVKQRFPSLSREELKRSFTFPPITIDPKNKVTTRKRLPKLFKFIYIEKSVLDSPLVARLKKNFPNSTFKTISTYKDFIQKKPYRLQDYNRREKSFFIIKESFDFYKKCPCTQGALRCGYHNMKLGWGCAFECIYCFLPAYVNSPGIVIPANIEDFLKAFEKYPQIIRLGTGQFTDSLIFDDITGFSPIIINFFRKRPKSTFEFKTKSDNVGLLLKQKPSKNIVVGWSLNPQRIIKETEFYTASLKQRFAAAKKCVKRGYRVSFHFDPIIHYKGWEKDYRAIVEAIFAGIPSRRIAWISLGTLRMTWDQKRVIENRFPNNSILNGELIPGFDKKLRYPKRVRQEIYKTMNSFILSRSKSIPTYLCMESQEMCKKIQLDDASI